jgi:type IV pilus assembly protein PilC
VLYNYKTTDKTGQMQNGSLDAPNVDLAIAALQRRGLFVVKVAPAESKTPLFSLHLFDRIKVSEVVILSRQISTLFEAKVSVVETFRLLASEAENPLIRRELNEVMDDIKGGVTISDAMRKHPDLFSDFYVSMVKSGEESGKLAETFHYLADYLDRSYALSTKARNALIYPAFVVVSFLVVMAVMIVFVIPRLGEVLKDTGQDLPVYTKVVLAVSGFISSYWLLFAALLVALGIFLVRYLPTKNGKEALGKFKLGIPYVGDLYRKLYLSRIADNLNTMITSGVSMVRALEITGDVVDNDMYKSILLEASNGVKGGSAVSEVLGKYPEVPKIMVEMMKVGEETGRLGYVLETMAKFYQREVDNAVDTLVGLIEPFMIVFLGLAVGVLLTSVLVPIYNVASGL